jgi:hypothetical protein
MKDLIVHYGLAKTGTTAIQFTFHQERARLLEHGLLYPVTGAIRAHHALTPLYQPFEDLHPDIRYRFRDDPAQARANARRVWEQIKREVDRKKPERMLISSEFFFTRATAEGQERFRAILSEVSPAIGTCVYVRSPAPHFLSLAQQSAKSAGTVGPPRPLSVRRNIEVIEAAFGARMLVRPFEPRQLQDGDVVADMLGRVLDMPALVHDLRPQRLNESLSAEAMAIVSAHRGASYPGLDGVQMPASRLLIDRLTAIEQAAGRSKRPVLKPEVAAAIVRAASDLHWLRERYDIVFEDVDYGRVDGASIADLEALTGVADICELDAAWRDELTQKLMQQGLEAQLQLAQIGRILPHDRIASGVERLDTAFAKVLRRFRRLRGRLV